MDVDVALVRWPTDDVGRRELAVRRRPRLLLVAKNADPPLCTDYLEDWVRLPVSDADARARVKALEGRIRELTPLVPSLVDRGTLQYRSARIELSPLQALLLRPLIDPFGVVVSREILMQKAWPDADPNRNILDVHMVRLRRRLVSAGLQIRTVRSRGYLLTESEAENRPHPDGFGSGRDG